MSGKAARVILPWLFSAFTMFGLSYFWHGVVLTDLQRIEYPFGLFFLLASLLYVSLAAALLLLIRFVDIKMGNALKGLLIGGLLGFLVYLIAFTLGISFQPNPEIKHLALDFTWQMLEQGVGGFVCGLVYQGVQNFQARPKPLE